MRRVVTVAAFLLLLTSLPLSAQRGGMRGGGHLGGFGGHSFVSRPGAHGFGGMHSGLSHNFGDRGFHDGFFRNGFRHHRCFGCRSFGFPWGYAGYGYYAPYWWDDFYYDDYRFDAQQAREEALANEMDRLNIEEQRFRNREDAWDRQRDQDAYARQDQDRYARRTQTQPQASSAPAPSTVLVFRDQHKQEVQNYAIADGTLWVLTAQTAKKIPLSELDLDATQKANDDRGVEFQTPR